MKILVCGGRNYADVETVNRVLGGVKPTYIIQGGAAGADRLAVSWAKHNGIPYATFEAEWDRYGASAGPKRNQRMLDDGWPDLVVAFPGGAGTADMVRRAKRAKITVMEIS